MLRKRTEAVKRVDLGENRRAALRKLIFEYELANGLISLKDAMRKAEEYGVLGDRVLDNRMELFFAHSQLIAKKPNQMETEKVPFFVEVVRTNIEAVRGKDPAFAWKCDVLLFEIETQLYLIACTRYYYYDDQGMDNPDAEESCTRFTQAAKRILPRLIRDKFAADPKLKDLNVERNFTYREVLRIFDGNVFDDNLFESFLERLDENAVLSSAQQLIVELQLSRYGSVTLPAATLNNIDDDEIRSGTIRSEATTSPVAKSSPKRQRTLARAATTTSRMSGLDIPLPTVSKPTTPVSISQISKKRANNERDSRGTVEGVDSGSVAKSRVRFSADEDNALEKGVRRYGAGAWSKILTDKELRPVFSSSGKERTAVNLKDRWRSIQHLRG